MNGGLLWRGPPLEEDDPSKKALCWGPLWEVRYLDSWPVDIAGHFLGGPHWWDLRPT